MSTESYEQAGVRQQGEAISSIVRHLGPTIGLPEGVETLTTFGQYASVLKVSDDIAIAISTDGVGSKTIIASRLDRYDTIGFDCVAMNVNDILCVGARPFAMVDYLGVHTLDPRRADEVLRGLAGAAKEAGIAIPGGELAQLPEVIGSDGTSPGDVTAFDLVGTCIGRVHPNRVVLGRDVTPGDAIVGIASSGIHSNGLTLARKVLLHDGGHDLDEEIAVLGRSLGEELLQPTEIYVRAIVALWDAGIETHGLAHITSDGFMNLTRVLSDTGYEIDNVPDIPPIFELIRDRGSVDIAEMFSVFNMGIGFCVVLPEEEAPRAISIINQVGKKQAWVIGRAVRDARKRVRLHQYGLVGEGKDFRHVARDELR